MLRNLAEAISMTLIMGSSSFCFMGAPWPPSLCSSYPDLTLLSKWAHLQQISTQALPTVTIKPQQSTNKKQLHCPHTYTSLLPLERCTAPVSPHNLPSRFSRDIHQYNLYRWFQGLNNDSMTQETTFQTSFRKPFLKTHTIKTSEIPSAGSPKNYKRAITLPTNSHPFLLNTCLRSKLCPKTSSLHTPPNPALTQPTSPLNKNPSFAKGNFICPMCASPNIKPLIRHCCHVFHGL